MLRAKGSDVIDGIVDDSPVVRDRRITTVDVEALAREVRADVTRFEAKPPDPGRLRKLDAIRPHLHAWRRDILRHLDVTEPFYRLNGQA